MHPLATRFRKAYRDRLLAALRSACASFLFVHLLAHIFSRLRGTRFARTLVCGGAFLRCLCRHYSSLSASTLTTEAYPGWSGRSSETLLRPPRTRGSVNSGQTPQRMPYSVKLTSIWRSALVIALRVVGPFGQRTSSSSGASPKPRTCTTESCDQYPEPA
jgi:hypothetical protein